MTVEARHERYRSEGWWPGTLVTDLFDAAVRERPSATALVDPPNRAALIGGEPRRPSWAELARWVEGYALRLIDLGLRRGDILVVQLPNVAEFAATYLAAMRLGVIVSPVPMQFRSHELRQIVSVTHARAVLTVPQFKGAPFGAEAREAATRAGALPLHLGAEPGSPAIGFHPVLEGDAARLEARLREEPVSSRDVATICWTSGTEGVPKGVPRTHDHWLAHRHAHVLGADIREHDTLLNPFPLVNMAAIGGCFLSWLHVRGTLVLHHPVDLQVYLAQIATERPQYVIAAPAVLNMLLQDERLLAQTDLSSLRCIGSGSAPLDPAVIRGFRERFGIEVVNMFGSNEGMSLFSGPRETSDPEQRARYFPRFGRADIEWPQGMGRWIETRIVDPDTGTEILASGRPGEMQIRGPTVFGGYFAAPRLNENAFTADGFFHTGDLFEIASDPRYYRFVGRLKQLIIRGGLKIAPDEVEAVLVKHPGIAEACVLGFRDPTLGERICAVIVRRPGSEPVTLDSVRELFRAQGMAVFKWPERIRETDALPRNALGKVVRAELQTLAEQPG